MPKVMLLGGRPILVGGRVAMSSACCCGGAVGACCLAETCSIVPEASCAGNYLGDGTTCDGVDCAHGACCHPNSTCDAETFVDCLAGGGAYQGDGTNCNGVDCIHTGACCNGSGCDITIQSDCEGSYQGDGSDCDPNPCTVTGSCCVPDEGCIPDIISSDCLALGGAWGTDPCEDFCGACCTGVATEPDNCHITSFVGCRDTSFGDWQGGGTSCSPDPCEGCCCNANISFITSGSACSTLDAACFSRSCSDGYAFTFDTECDVNGPNTTPCCPDGINTFCRACCFPDPGGFCVAHYGDDFCVPDGGTLSESGCCGGCTPC